MSTANQYIMPQKKETDKRVLVKVFERCTQWLMCCAPPPGLLEMEPVLGSLAGLDSTAAVAASAVPINAITAFSGRFSGPIFF